VCWTTEGNRIHDVIVCDIRPDMDVIDLQRATPDNLRSFAANAAWLALAAIAHNLTRAAGCLASLFHAKARTGTLRRHLIIVPARIARRSRRITLHLPLNWPQRDAFSELFTTTHAPPHTV
jgi:hypothetical protein